MHARAIVSRASCTRPRHLGWRWPPDRTSQSTRTPKGVRAFGAPIPWAPVTSNVMPHGKGRVSSQQFISGEDLAQLVHFAGGSTVSRLQARAPVGRSPAWPAGPLDAQSRALHQHAWHRAPCEVTRKAARSKLHSGAPAWSALTGRHNTSVEMDAPVRPCAARTRLWCATHVQR
jgi:hypothetical protein